MALFDIDGFAADQTILKCNGTMMDSTTLLTLLVVLRKYGNINTLNLSDSGLSSKSIEILAKYLPETSITSLILDYNINIQNSCMEVIASKNNSKLQSISLRGCKINDECISKLVEVLWINGLLTLSFCLLKAISLNTGFIFWHGLHHVAVNCTYTFVIFGFFAIL